MTARLKLRKLLLQLIGVGFFSLLIGFSINTGIQFKSDELQNRLLTHEYALDSTFESFNITLNELLQVSQLWGDDDNVSRKKLASTSEIKLDTYMKKIEQLSDNKKGVTRLKNTLTKLKWAEWKLFDIETNTDDINDAIIKHRNINKYYDILSQNINYLIYHANHQSIKKLARLNNSLIESHFMLLIRLTYHKNISSLHLEQLYKNQSTTLSQIAQLTNNGKSIRQVANQYLMALKKALKSNKTSSRINTETYFSNSYLPTYKSMRAALQDMIDANDESITHVIRHIALLNSISTIISFGLLTFFGIYSFIFIRRMTRYVLTPAEILNQKMIEAAHKRNIDIITPSPALHEFDQLFSQFKILLSQRDLYERNLEDSKSHIEYLSRHDSLTGLPNSSYFSSQFEHMRANLPADHHILFIVLKLQNYEILASFLGDNSLNNMIAKFSKALKTFKQHQSIFGILSDTSFLIAISSTRSISIDEILHEFNRHMLSLEKNLFDSQLLRYAMGVSIYPDHSKEYDTLVRYSRYIASKSAIDEIKHYAIFNRTIDHELKSISELEKDLIRGLNKNEFYLVYQPQCDAQSGDIIGCEALMRWHHSTLGEISPSIFISVAEKTGMIRQLTNFVLETALSDYRKISTNSKKDLKLSLNASLVDLLSTTYFDLLLGKTKQFNISPASISIEVTETMINFSPIKIENALNQLKTHGFSIAMDDFGSGYSSLERLSHYEFDFIKVDKGFLDSITRNKKYQSILKTILEMIHQLGAESIMEGVETESQLKLVQGMNCDYIQGYYFSKPLRFNDLVDFIKKHQ